MSQTPTMHEATDEMLTMSKQDLEALRSKILAVHFYFDADEKVPSDYRIVDQGTRFELTGLFLQALLSVSLPGYPRHIHEVSNPKTELELQVAEDAPAVPDAETMAFAGLCGRIRDAARSAARGAIQVIEASKLPPLSPHLASILTQYSAQGVVFATGARQKKR